MSQEQTNIAAPSRVTRDAFSGTVTPDPIQVTESDRLTQMMIINQEFDAIFVGMPTWHAEGCSMLFQLYAWTSSTEETLLTEPRFYERIE